MYRLGVGNDFFQGVRVGNLVFELREYQGVDFESLKLTILIKFSLI